MLTALLSGLVILASGPANRARAASAPARPHVQALMTAPAGSSRVSTPLLAMTRSVDYSQTPANFRTAYSLPKTGARHQTIAVVSAYNDPSVQSDLNDYTKRFGIRPCTIANGCFRELNQEGAASPLPETDPTGEVFLAESSIGTEIARGICQSCRILLVEANAADEADISVSVKTAIDAGATVVVTAFNQSEAATDPKLAGNYSSPRAVVVAASGDTSYTQLPLFPATLPNVLAVGGTDLALSASGSRLGETAWQGTTSGCSLHESAPAWQSVAAKSVGCGTRRAEVDLSAAADPGALVRVQDAPSPCGKKWCAALGTSVAAPIIAGVIGLAGSDGSGEARLLYQHFTSNPGAFHDITSGANGNCGGKPICTARKGYDGPTGLGTPDGLAAFLRNGGVVNRSRPGFTIASPSGALRVSSGWTTTLTLRNGNAFALRGSIALQGKARVGGRIRPVTFASRSFTLGSLGSAAVKLTIANAGRQLLSQLRSAQVTIAVRLRGPAGAAVNTSRSRRLIAP